MAVVTFEPHPLTVLRPDRAPPRLTPPPLKREALARLGVDHLAVLPPTPDVLGLSAEDFWHLLRDGLRPAAIVEGPTFIFGKNRGGDMAKLRAWAAETVVRVHTADAVTVPLLDMHVPPVSSTLIRWLLLNGRARDAAICLGRPYTLRGTVVKGFQRGRTIGVPTANLDVRRAAGAGRGRVRRAVRRRRPHPRPRSASASCRRSATTGCRWRSTSSGTPAICTAG